MSNRVFTSRLDFTPGWVVRAARYSVPGAPAEMYNTQLDLLAEGALRQTWGASPFAFWGDAGTGSQYRLAAADGRYPGVCHVDRIKAGNDGEQDTVIVCHQVPNGSAVDTQFRWISAPETSTKIMNMVHGNTFTVAGKGGVGLVFYYADLCFLMGEERLDYPMTASLTTGAGTLTAYGLDLGIEYTPPGVSIPTYEEVEIELTHTETAETATVILALTTDADYQHSNQYHTSIGNPYPDQTVISTESGTFTVYDTKVSPQEQHPQGSWWFTASTVTGAGGSLAYFQNDFVHYRLYEMDGGYNRLYWENYNNSQTNPVAFGSSTLTPTGTTTFYHYIPVQPSRSQQDKSTYLGQGTAERLIYTAASISQPKIGPLGIWKSATMNGRAYFFNGYSGTSVWVDIDDPTTTGQIGKERPDASGISLTLFTKGAGEKTHYPKGKNRYWFAEIDESGLESSLATDRHDINNDKWSTMGVKINDIPPATNTLSYWRIYRSFSKDKSPYFLKDMEEGHSTSTWEDYAPDDTLGDPPWTHGDVPPYDAFCPVVYYDRLWVLGSRPGVANAARTTLFWSDINEPESFWWDGNWANVYGDDGDEVTALVRDRTGLLVFKNNHLYLMSGRSPQEISFNEITVEDSDTGVGCPHPNAVVATDFGVFFYWNRGIYRYFQGQAQKISHAIAPLIEGRQDIFQVRGDNTWPYYGRSYGWSVTMGYDNVSEVVYFGCQGDFPTVLFDPSDVAKESNNEITCLLDARNARWIGMYSYHFGFVRRANVTMYENWADPGNNQDWTGNMLVGGLMSSANVNDLGYSYNHPIAFIPGTAAMGNMGINHKAKFRPIVGNLGPYSSKRFLYVDYLVDEQGIDYGGQDSALKSVIYLDGSITGTASTLTIGGGQVYSDQIRHVYGSVGAEVEAEVVFDPNQTGDLIRLFEYSIGWQNLGRERAEGPGAGGSSPPGGPGWTSPPVVISTPGASR